MLRGCHHNPKRENSREKIALTNDGAELDSSDEPGEIYLADIALITMPDIIDDKSEHCIPFMLERLKIHQERHAGNPHVPPFFLGMNGVQGAGKTTLVGLRLLSCALLSSLQLVSSSEPFPGRLELISLFSTHSEAAS